MPFDWKSLLGALTGTAAVVAAIGWSAKLLAEHVSKLHREAYKAALTEQESRLKHDLDKKLEIFKGELSTSNAEADRRRAEITKWSGPILHSISGLKSRLENIVENEGYVVLDSQYTKARNKNWSIDHRYMLYSTVYQFSLYSCWMLQMRLSINFEMFSSEPLQADFFRKIEAVSKALGSFPFEGPNHGSGNDAQVFRLQQQAMGEALLINGKECMGYADFTKMLNDGQHAEIYQPMLDLLINVRPGDVRFDRLRLLLKRTRELSNSAETILRQKRLD